MAGLIRDSLAQYATTTQHVVNFRTIGKYPPRRTMKAFVPTGDMTTTERRRELIEWDIADRFGTDWSGVVQQHKPSGTGIAARVFLAAGSLILYAVDSDGTETEVASADVYPQGHAPADIKEANKEGFVTEDSPVRRRLCLGCSDQEVISALETGELIDLDNDGTTWPCGFVNGQEQVPSKLNAFTESLLADRHTGTQTMSGVWLPIDESDYLTELVDRSGWIEETIPEEITVQLRRDDTAVPELRPVLAAVNDKQWFEFRPLNHRDGGRGRS